MSIASLLLIRAVRISGLCLIAELHRMALLITIVLEIVGVGTGFNPGLGHGTGSGSALAPGVNTVLGGKFKNWVELRIDWIGRPRPSASQGRSPDLRVRASAFPLAFSGRN